MATSRLASSICMTGFQIISRAGSESSRGSRTKCSQYVPPSCRNLEPPVHRQPHRLTAFAILNLGTAHPYRQVPVTRLRGKRRQTADVEADLPMSNPPTLATPHLLICHTDVLRGKPDSPCQRRIRLPDKFGEMIRICARWLHQATG